MNESIVLSAIIRTVPQWYPGERGPYRYALELRDTVLPFCTHRPLTTKLQYLLAYALSKMGNWELQIPPIPTPRSIGKIGEDLAMEWLNVHDPTVNWNKWIAYAETLALKTYENERIVKNLVITDGVGSVDFTDRRMQKVFEPLAADPQTYVKVDKELRFLDYDEILWGDVKDSEISTLSPEFLQPVVSILGAHEYYAHLTGRGEIIVLGNAGVLASYRKGQWHVYDGEGLRDCMAEIVGDSAIGRNIVEILFDLSYQRHGALLVFDPYHEVIKHVVNRASLVHGEGPIGDLPRYLLAPRVRELRIGSANPRLRKKRLFLEVASIDGAVIFDAKQVLAVGAMIEAHPDVGSLYGARTTAARSALLWGGHAFMVSADGEITVLFKDEDNATSGELHFM